MENTSSRKLKVLWLHGVFGSAAMMDYQIDYYKYLFKDYIEFVSLNGPYQCSKEIVDPEISSKFSGPYFAWYTFDPESKQVKNYIESLEYVIDFINKNGPFDGILAYSQGINISRVLIKLEKLGSEYPKIPFENLNLLYSLVHHYWKLIIQIMLIQYLSLGERTLMYLFYIE